MKGLWWVLGAPVLLAGLACSNGPTDPAAEPTVLTLPELTLSNAISASALGIPLITTVGTAGGEAAAYVSLPTGTLPHMVGVLVRNVTADLSSPTIPMVDGGFDPVPVAGEVGDELELSFTDGDGSVSVAYAIIPSESPPTVVRTNPPRGRTDVALSPRVTVVFSEPIDPATLALGVRLLTGGVEVAATVHLLSEQPWAAELVPAALLQPETVYELHVTTEVRDLDGDGLAEPVIVPFTTGRAAAAPASATLQIVSGNDQPGKAGSDLPEPLVVRVTDATGAGLPGVEVAWTVTSGEGALNGLWTKCPGIGWAPTDDLASPVPTTTVATNASGLAEVSLMPTWFGPVTVTATLPGATLDRAVSFETDASDPNATLEIVPGYAAVQEQWYWELMILQTPPLVVAVKDGQGSSVPFVRVNWAVESGDAVLGSCPDWWPAGVSRTTRTRVADDGVSQAAMRVQATGIGSSTVTASVLGVGGSPVAFSLDVTVALIYVDGFLVSEGRFRGPYDNPDVAVPVGTRVEFPIVNPTAHIVSTSSPPGGVSFDSGPLESDWRSAEKEWFGFVPNVVGTWTFVDQITGATGTVTAY
jgi:hypothetical protein